MVIGIHIVASTQQKINSVFVSKRDVQSVQFEYWIAVVKGDGIGCIKHLGHTFGSSIWVSTNQSAGKNQRAAFAGAGFTHRDKIGH